MADRALEDNHLDGEHYPTAVTGCRYCDDNEALAEVPDAERRAGCEETCRLCGQGRNHGLHMPGVPYGHVFEPTDSGQPGATENVHNGPADTDVDA